MTRVHSLPVAPRGLVSYYWHCDVLRSRSVGSRVISTTLDVSAPPTRLLSDWERELSVRLDLAPGEVESLPLARARMRWPGYKDGMRAMAGWARSLGFADLLAESEVALMACRGARYHHDGDQYGGAAFCNLFVSEDKGLDLRFASADGNESRIALRRGTAVIFDTCRPHAVVRRDSAVFDAADFANGQDSTQVFLTWELPVEPLEVALGIEFDIDPRMAAALNDAQLRFDGTRVTVCPASGRWLPV